jgi:hypothetical protein
VRTVVFTNLPLQGDDDLHSLLHDLSSSPTLPESTALIWGSSEEVGADPRPGSSCSGSILQPDSPMGDSQVRPAGSWVLTTVQGSWVFLQSCHAQSRTSCLSLRAPPGV